jgi:glycerophosphoryl diester phosphodiesterase
MLVFAHRGIHDRKNGENTLAAFARAVAFGVDGIEFDLRLSRDGVAVAVHDEHLDRVAGDARRIRDLTADELGEVVLRGNGSIPTLNEITASVPAPMLFDIEIKDREAIPLLLAKLRTSSNLRERVIVSSFVLDDLAEIKAEFPTLRTISLNRTWPLPFRGRGFWQRLKAANVWAVGFPATILNARRVASIRRQGWAVAAWDLQPLARESRRVARLCPDIAVVYRPEACS